MTDNIAKPSTFDLNKFASKRSATVASVEPYKRHCRTEDFVRLHPDEDTH